MVLLKWEVNKAGGLNHLVDEKTRKSRPVYIPPIVMIPLREKNTSVIDFTALVFGVKEPEKTAKTLTMLKRLIREDFT